MKILGVNLPDKMPEFRLTIDFKRFEGVINKVEKHTLANTSGDTHEYYATFNIDGKAFRCGGDYAFKDGDELVFLCFAYKRWLLQS